MSVWQLSVVVAAGWLHRDHRKVIEFLLEEIRTLKELLPEKRRLRFTAEQKRRLAVKGKELGYRLLKECCNLVTPETILRWHRELIARKWDYSARRQKKVGRPATEREVAELVVRLARENEGWGYGTIQGALRALGHELSRTTIGKILREHGLEPAPRRGMSWKTFIQSHLDCLAACDFTTVEIWNKGSLITYYVLFVIELATRRVHLVGLTPSPDQQWMSNVARSLIDDFDGFLKGKRYLILDRDAIFNGKFKAIIENTGVEVLTLPPRSPDLNSYCERFHRSVKEQCLNKLIFFSERSLRHAIVQYLAFYHHERPHQGLGNNLVDPQHDVQASRDVTLPIRASATARWSAQLLPPSPGRLSSVILNSWHVSWFLRTRHLYAPATDFAPRRPFWLARH